MAFYSIEVNEKEAQVTISEAVSDGANDSQIRLDGCFKKITEENASPLVLKIKSELSDFQSWTDLVYELEGER